MKEPCYLALDIGTSSCKAAVFDSACTLLELAQEGYDLLFPQPGWVEQDIAQMIRSVKVAVGTLSQRCGGLSGVRAISFSAQISAQCLVAEDGTPLTRLISWMDKRAQAQAERFCCEHDAQWLRQQTGIEMVVTPAYSIAKLMWLAEHEREKLNKAKYFVQFKELLIHELTGQWVSDPTSLKGLVHQQTFEPAYGVLEAIGVSARLIPPVRRPSDIAGYLKPGIEGFDTIRPGTPVIVGWNDMNAAFLGMAALPERIAGLDMTGTSEHFGVVVSRAYLPASLPSYEGLNRVDFMENWEAFYGVTNTGGQAPSWFASRIAGKPAGECFSRLRLEMLADPGFEQLICLPYVAGERNPISLPSGMGAFIGMNSETVADHLALSVLEGICFALRMIFDRLPVKPTEIVVSGGASGNDMLNQFKADVLNVPYVRMQTDQAGCRGACLLAIASQEGLAGVARCSVRAEKRFIPNAERHEMEEKKYRRFLQFVKAMTT